MLFQAPKRIAILRAALELFADRGYQRTSIAEITRCGGVTLDTFYKYFGSKQQLAQVMYEDVERERDCYLEVLPPENASLQQQFLLLWCRMVDFAVQYPDAMHPWAFLAQPAGSRRVLVLGRLGWLGGRLRSVVLAVGG